MNLIATTEGALAFLASAQLWQRQGPGTPNGTDWRVRLSGTNITVNDATTLSMVTELSGGTGYAFVQPAWSTAALIGGVPTVASPLVTFTLTSGFPVTAFIIYVTDAANLKFVGAANFSPSVTFTALQPTYSAYINVTCTSQF